MGPLTILVTGAAGFLGQATVRAALAQGHRVRALTRRPAALPAGAEPFVADLSVPGPVPGRALLGVQAVIHCAARLSGTEAEHQRDTVAATEHLCHAILTTGQRPRLVLAGSLSVYGAGHLPPGALLDESCPLEPRPDLRDAYTRAKLAQEAVARRLAAAGKLPLWTLRAGLLWGAGHLDNAHLGIRLGPLLLRPGAGQLPLAHVDHVAAALLAACRSLPVGMDEAVNILDDDLPSRTRYLAAVGRVALPLHWRIPDSLAGMLAPLGPRLPGLLRRPVLRARLMPLRYSNAQAKARLDWRPHLPFDIAIRQAMR